MRWFKGLGGGGEAGWCGGVGFCLGGARLVLGGAGGAWGLGKMGLRGIGGGSPVSYRWHILLMGGL